MAYQLTTLTTTLKASHLNGFRAELAKPLNSLLSIVYENTQVAKGLQAILLDKISHGQLNSNQKFLIEEILTKSWENEKIIGSLLDIFSETPEPSSS